MRRKIWRREKKKRVRNRERESVREREREGDRYKQVKMEENSLPLISCF